MDFLLAILPIGLLIYVMTKKKSWPSHISLPLAATLVSVLALVHSRLDPNLVNATVVNGTLSALTPISIIWGAICFQKRCSVPEPNESSTNGLRKRAPIRLPN